MSKMIVNRARFFLVFLLVFFVAAQPVGQAANVDTSTQATIADLDNDDTYLDEVAIVPVNDPLEGWNRAVFTFNDAMLDYVARPLHEGYTTITPGFMRTGISNFFHNLMFPVRFTNNILQGRFRGAGVEMSRFVLNSTAGLGGFIDVAQYKEPIVPVEDEDFGQTLGVWGFGEGIYIVWPVLGPSTARDSFGTVGDYFLSPITYVKPDGLSWGLAALRTFNDLDATLDAYDSLKGLAVEPYTAVRDGYIQFRKAQIAK